MFIPVIFPTQNEVLLSIGAIRRAFVEGGKFFVGDDNGTYETSYSLELIETMACPIMSAQDGYTKLFYSFNAKMQFPAHPVIAWRIRTPYAPEPISLFDDQFAPPGLTAIRYPDGRVLVMDSELDQPLLADTESWHSYVAQERLVWLKNGGGV